jgi:hypothetical protein
VSSEKPTDLSEFFAQPFWVNQEDWRKRASKSSRETIWTEPEADSGASFWWLGGQPQLPPHPAPRRLNQTW